MISSYEGSTYRFLVQIWLGIRIAEKEINGIRPTGRANRVINKKPFLSDEEFVHFVRASLAPISKTLAHSFSNPTLFLESGTCFLLSNHEEPQVFLRECVQKTGIHLDLTNIASDYSIYLNLDKKLPEEKSGLAFTLTEKSQKKSELISSRAAIARNKATTEEYEFSYEGRKFIVYPHVYSPKVFPSTFYYTEYMNITPGQSLLEIGSGTGLLAITAAPRGASPVITTDISPLAVANTEENIRRYDLNSIMDAREGSVFDPIKEGETFDIILWNVPYMHIDKVELSPIEIALYDPYYKALTRFFAEAKSYLKPGEKLWFGSSSTHMHQDVLQKLVDTYG
jgi:release factor glutamine methyltransferase